MIDQVFQDTRYAIRSLLRRPAHTMTAAFCLAVGLTVSIVTFSVLVSFFVGDQPGVSQRSRIIEIHLRHDTEKGPVDESAFSHQDFRDLETPPPAVKNIAAETELAVAARGNHDAIGVRAAFVSGNYFALLQTKPQKGRLILPVDDVSGAPAVVVVSDYFWRTQLDAAESAIGRSIVVSGRSVVVVGVAPPRFHGLTGLDVGGPESQGRQMWMPLAQAVAGWPGAPKADNLWLSVVGRLAENHSAKDAEAQLSARAAAIAARHHDWGKTQAVVSKIGMPPGSGMGQLFLLICTFLSAPLAVLGVSCANVANLQLGRVTERIREIAVRVSFGATRAQILRLLTIETMGFALLSLAVSAAATLGIFNVIDGFFPRILSLDWRVALFSIALMMVVTLSTGVAPAWIVLRRSTNDVLKQTRQTSGILHSRLRSTLVVIQVAISLAMLCGNGLFMHSLVAKQLSVPPAMRSQLVAEFDPRQLGTSLSDSRHFTEELMRRVADDPRVDAVSLSRKNGVRYFLPADDPAIERYAPLVEITPDWLRMMNMTVLAGRALTDRDAPQAVLVNKSFAQAHIYGGDLLGRLLRLQMEQDGEMRTVEVVGIVSDNQMGPMLLPGETPDPVIYALFRADGGPFTLWIKSGNVNELSNDLRGIVRELDPRLPWLSLRRGEEMYLRDAPTIRQVAFTIGGLGLLALTLAVIGLYAVMSYLVLLRRHEISVRIAVGAKSRDIVRMMLTHAARLVVMGTAIGLTLSFILALILRATLFTAPLFAPGSFLPQLGLIALATLIAAFIPSYLASRTNPMQLLKVE